MNNIDLGAMRRRRDSLALGLNESWTAAHQLGRSIPTPQENAAFTEWRSLTTELKELEADEARGDISNLSSRIGGTTSSRKPAMKDFSHLTYRGANDNRASWLRDLILTNQQRDDTGECRRRLAAHADEVKSDPFFDPA